MSASIAPPSLTPGDVLDERFVVEEAAGRGGLGTVFRGWDLEREVAVAIKILIALRPTDILRFRREATVLAMLRLPGVVRYIATTSLDNTARIWDAERGTELFKLQHPSIVVSATFAAGGELLVTTGEDPLVRMWESRSGKELLRLDAHTAMVWRATFSSDERLLATAGFDGKAVVLALPR